jgi:GntR family transcriptional regulator, transcriptional repressor for pyruvate dehydrogenase complex
MPRRPSLTVEVADDIRRKILDGRLAGGSRIPTEETLGVEYQVSRTVIREAIARLRSEGLLSSRPGIGVFVSGANQVRRFEIDWDSIRSLPEEVALLEFTAAILIEASGLSAERRTATDLKALRHWLKVTDVTRKSLEDTRLHYDFDLYLAIAKATHNPRYNELLQSLRPIIAPRVSLRELAGEHGSEGFSQRVQHEHETIVEAIEASNAKLARQAMRRHVDGNLARMRALITAYGVERGESDRRRVSAATVRRATAKGRRDIG